MMLRGPQSQSGCDGKDKKSLPHQTLVVQNKSNINIKIKIYLNFVCGVSSSPDL
jgi:hypothetical protein